VSGRPSPHSKPVTGLGVVIRSKLSSLFATHRSHLSSHQCAYQAATGRCPEATTGGRGLSDEPKRAVYLPDFTGRSWDTKVVGIRHRRVVGLHCVGSVGPKSRFSVLGIQHEHDGSEERIVHRDAIRESTSGIHAMFCFELKNRSLLPLGWVVGKIRIHARAWGPPSRYPAGKLRHRFTAKRTDYLHDRLWIFETVHRPKNESAYTNQPR